MPSSSVGGGDKDGLERASGLGVAFVRAIAAKSVLGTSCCCVGSGEKVEYVRCGKLLVRLVFICRKEWTDGWRKERYKSR